MSERFNGKLMDNDVTIEIDHEGTVTNIYILNTPISYGFPIRILEEAQSENYEAIQEVLKECNDEAKDWKDHVNDMRSSGRYL
jgi:uncharacterized protein YuzE